MDVNHKNIISKFFETDNNRNLDNFYINLCNLLKLLKKDGLDRKTVTQDLIDEITSGFLGKAKDLYKIKFGYCLTFYINDLIDLDFSEASTIEELKPEDFTPKQYDSEFIELMGVVDEVDG